MLALVMSALAPTLAHAWVAAADEGQWIEVCSASGMVWLKGDAADGLNGIDQGVSDQDAPMADMGKHCPWCSFHGAAAGLPPALGPVHLSSSDTQFFPLGSDGAPPAQAQRGIQARAPPTAS